MKKRGEKGVTLIALAITIAVLSILAFSITANTGGFNDMRNKTKFEEDIHKLSEQVEQYYARYKIYNKILLSYLILLHPHAGPCAFDRSKFPVWEDNPGKPGRLDK